MLCSQCGCALEDSQVTWFRGSAFCPTCAQKARTFGRTMLVIVLVVGILMLAVPLLLCVGGGFLFRFFQ
jgi:hypothetical protein